MPSDKAPGVRKPNKRELQASEVQQYMPRIHERIADIQKVLESGAGKYNNDEMDIIRSEMRSLNSYLELLVGEIRVRIARFGEKL